MIDDHGSSPSAYPAIEQSKPYQTRLLSCPQDNIALSFEKIIMGN
jgi:hypothetical protein